jgi:hypothetical protein
MSDLLKKIAVAAVLLSVLRATVPVQAETYVLQNGRNGPGGHPYAGTEDTHISSGKMAEATPGGAAELSLGFNGTDVSRILLRFALEDVESHWTTDSRITGARLRLYIKTIESGPVRDLRLQLHRVAAANSTWAAGNLDEDASGSGFACWRWIAYNDTNYAMSDPRASGFDHDVPRRFPWAGDKAAFEKTWPDLTTFKGSGCGVAGAVKKGVISGKKRGHFVMF